MKRTLAIILAALCLALVFAGCDERGGLNEREVRELYEEAGSLISSGELWSYGFEPFWENGWDSDESRDISFEFVRAAVEKAFELYGEEKFYGYWFSSRRYCSWIAVNTEFQLDVSYGSYLIDSIAISKYASDGYWRIDAAYHFEDDETQKNVAVKFTP